METAGKLLGPCGGNSARFGPADGAGLLLGGDFLTWAETSFTGSSQKGPEETSSCCQAEVRGPPRVRGRAFRC